MVIGIVQLVLRKRNEKLMRFGFSYKECKESIAQWYEEAKELIACQPD